MPSYGAFWGACSTFVPLQPSYHHIPEFPYHMCTAKLYAYTCMVCTICLRYEIHKWYRALPSTGPLNRSFFLNNTLCTEVSFQMFYNMSSVLFFKNSINKVSGLLFSFFCVSMGHSHFWNKEICIFWVPTRPSAMFFSCIMPEKSARKARELLCIPGFQFTREIHLRAKAY